MTDPEAFWGQILSRDAGQVRAAWETLAKDEQDTVRAHLIRMVSEDGWAEPQRISAQAALDALTTGDDSPPDQA